MRDTSTPRVYIISAHVKNPTGQSNHSRHCDLAADLALAGVHFTEVSGSFDGVPEAGYLVVGAEHGPTIATLAQHFGQECYLVVAEHDRTAYFVDTETGVHHHAGRWRHAGGEKPDGDFTELDGEFFTIDSSRRGPDLPEGL